MQVKINCESYYIQQYSRIAVIFVPGVTASFLHFAILFIYFKFPYFNVNTD